MKRLESICTWVVYGVLLSPPLLLAETTRVAVAANFSKPAVVIAKAFEKSSGHSVKISTGSTGKLYAQICHGAPYDIFFAADAKRPQLAEHQGYAVEGSRFTYARGKLALYSKNPSLIDKTGSILKAPNAFKYLAIANPKIAPYGTTAIETLNNLGLFHTLDSKIVRGDSVTQTYQFISTGNADLGFIALSQVLHHKEGAYWLVPQNLYTPINQDVVLLKRGATNTAALDFLEYFKSEEAKHLVATQGYDASTE